MVSRAHQLVMEVLFNVYRAIKKVMTTIFAQYFLPLITVTDALISRG